MSNFTLSHIFMFVSNRMTCSYADDTTIYVSDYKNEEIIRKLENDCYFINLVSG